MLSWANFAWVWFFPFFASAFFHSAFSVFVPKARVALNKKHPFADAASLAKQVATVHIVDQKAVMAVLSRNGQIERQKSEVRVAKGESKQATKLPSAQAGQVSRLLATASVTTGPELLELSQDLNRDGSFAEFPAEDLAMPPPPENKESAFESCLDSENESWLSDFRDFDFLPRSYRAVVKFAGAMEGSTNSLQQRLHFELLDFYPESDKPARYIDEKLAQFFLSCLNTRYLPLENAEIAARVTQAPTPLDSGEFLHEMKVIYTKTGVVLP